MPSPEPVAPRCLLIASGPPGVVIQVFDNDLQSRARGTEKVRARLPQGLYTVRWQAYDLAQERLVRLTPSKSAFRIALPSTSKARESMPRVAAPLEQVGVRTHSRRSEIVVVELSDDGMPEPQLSKGVRLFDRDDIAMRSDNAGLAAAQNELGDQHGAGWWAMRVYPVRPGLFRLRYDAQTGDTVDQTVPALRNRRTIVILRKGVAQTLVQQGGSYSTVSFCGVDTKRTTLLTTALRGNVRPTQDALRVVRLLEACMASGDHDLDENLLRRISSKTGDPLYRVYAAAILLGAFRPPQDASNAEDKAALATTRRQLVERIRACRPTVEALLKSLPPDNPDVIACRWRLSGLHAGPRPTHQIDAPPTLAVAWDWVTERETAALQPVKDTSSVRGATRGQILAGPWLAWLAAASKVGLVEDAPGLQLFDESHINAEIRRLQSLGQSLVRRRGDAWHLDVARLSLSPATLEVISLARAQFAPSIAAPDSIAATLARTLGVSQSALEARVQTAVDELEQFVAPDNRPRVGLSDRAPALSLPVLNFDDPQKGRFGGAAEAKGFQLKASFDDSEDPEWVKIRLWVTAPSDVQNGDVAIFYLHDTFKPNIYRRRFSGGRAKLTVHAFGGFTVGVWLPGPGVQLELDLAEIPGAPRAIKEW